MKKLIAILFIFITTAGITSCSSSGFVLNKPATTSSSPSAEADSNAKDFQQRKLHVLNHINERINKMQQIQSCVQVADDFQSMRACKPHRD
jgi:hypothetical protein